jgi:hypothetical protein
MYERAAAQEAAQAEVQSAVGSLAAGQHELEVRTAAAERRAAELEASFAAGLEAALARIVAGQAAAKAEVQAALASLAARQQDLESRAAAAERRLAGTEAALSPIAAAQAELRSGLADLIEAALRPHAEALERSLREQLRAATDSAAATIVRDSESRVARRVDPLEAALAAHDKLLRILKQRSEQGEAQSIAMLRTIGQVYHDAVQRLEAPPAPPQAVPSEAAGGQPETAPSPPGGPEQPPPPAAGSNASPEARPDAPNGAPEHSGDVGKLFADAPTPGRAWRIPLVSSLLMAAAGWAVLSYL